MKTSTIKQKAVILNVLLRLSQDPQALVEIYLNYDCDRTAIENMYERLVESVAKIGSTHFAGGKEGDIGAGGVGRNEGGRAGAGDKGPVIPPSLTTSAMGGGAAPGTNDIGGAKRGEAWAHLSPEVKLRRQSLECLVTVLRSLVQWGTAAPRASAAGGGVSSSAGGIGEDASGRNSEDVSREGGFGENGGSADRTGASSPTLAREEDDPERFESAKQRKSALMEGIKKFNFKPKRVSSSPSCLVDHVSRDKQTDMSSHPVVLFSFTFCAISGHSIPCRERLHPKQQPGRHCQVPFDGRWAEQSHDWRVPWRRVSSHHRRLYVATKAFCEASWARGSRSCCPCLVSGTKPTSRRCTPLSTCSTSAI